MRQCILPVYVVLAVGGYVVVDDQVHVRDVQAAGGHVYTNSVYTVQ